MLGALPDRVDVRVVGAQLVTGDIPTLTGFGGDTVSLELLGGFGGIIGTLLSAVVGAVLTGMLVVVVSEDALGRRVTAGQVWARVRPRLWALLVTALYRAGRQSDALAAHRRVARLLADELGVDPGPELAALERQVLTHDRALAPHGLSGNLPGLTTPLVGRTGSVTALVTALAAHRLVTVTGPAGVGATQEVTTARPRCSCARRGPAAAPPA